MTEKPKEDVILVTAEDQAPEGHDSSVEKNPYILNPDEDGVITYEEPEPLSPWFNIRHYLWMFEKGIVGSLPPELGPFPMLYKADDYRLGEQLQKWGVITDTEMLTPESEDLFSAIQGGYDWAVWGLALLYSERDRRMVTVPAPLLDTGIQFAFRDVPRIPFMICVRASSIISVVSTYERMKIDYHPRFGDVFKQVGDILKGIFDPQDEIAPLKMPTVSAGAELVLDLASNEETGAGMRPQDNEETRKEAAARVKDRVLKQRMSSTTARTLAQVAEGEVKVLVEAGLNANLEHRSGMVKGLSIGVMYYPNGVMVSYPEILTGGKLVVTYQSGEDKAFSKAVESLYKMGQLKKPRLLVEREGFYPN